MIVDSFVGFISVDILHWVTSWSSFFKAVRDGEGWGMCIVGDAERVGFLGNGWGWEEVPDLECLL